MVRYSEGSCLEFWHQVGSADTFTLPAHARACSCIDQAVEVIFTTVLLSPSHLDNYSCDVFKYPNHYGSNPTSLNHIYFSLIHGFSAIKIIYVAVKRLVRGGF